jgi:hypothetical protein
MGHHCGDINATFKMMENLGKKTNDNMAVIVGELERINVTIASMSNKLCNCGDKSPLLVGVGTQSSPFKLEYASDEEYTIPPMANTSPILVLALSTQTATPSDSDMENIPPSLIPRSALWLIVDDKEEGEGHLEVSEGWLSEMREVCEASGLSSTPIQRPVGVQRAHCGKGSRFDPTFGMCRPLGSRSDHAARMGYSPLKS